MEIIERYQKELEELDDLNRELKKSLKEMKSEVKSLERENQNLEERIEDILGIVEDLEYEMLDPYHAAIDYLSGNNLIAAMEIEEFIEKLNL